MDQTQQPLEALLREILIESKASDCEKDCANYIDNEFNSLNCNGCTLNPFYMNNFVLKTDTAS